MGRLERGLWRGGIRVILGLWGRWGERIFIWCIVWWIWRMWLCRLLGGCLSIRGRSVVLLVGCMCLS